jgi:hypothetical protein
MRFFLDGPRRFVYLIKVMVNRFQQTATNPTLMASLSFPSRVGATCSEFALNLPYYFCWWWNTYKTVGGVS